MYQAYEPEPEHPGGRQQGGERVWKAENAVTTHLDKKIEMTQAFRAIYHKSITIRDLKGSIMKKFLIERQIPGVGNMSLADLRTVARKSVNVLAGLGVEIQWVESFISGDKIYCIYLATDEELIREHARLTGIPANTITEVFRAIDPTVASIADSAVQ